MISIIALVVGLLGMFGLWALAWQLWNQALASEPILNAADSSARPSDWRNEPTPNRSTPAGPAQPHALPAQSVTEIVPARTDEPTEIEEAPVVRAHLSSSANTAFFSRSDLANLIDANVEKTAILHDDDILEEPTLYKEKSPEQQSLVPPVPKRKTKFFIGPPPRDPKSQSS